MIGRRFVGVIALLASAAASAQLANPSTSTGPVAPIQTPPVTTAGGGGSGAGQPTQPGSAAGAGVRAPDTYVLGPGDRVRISVFGEDRLSGEYVITSTGELSFPLIGNVRVSGSSIADLQSMLRAKLSSGYLKDPRITAEVLIFRPFYVLGEVARPGQYPYVDGLTIQQAIATAGGYTYRAKRSKIYLRAPQKENESVINLKKDPLKGVGPGDTIRVGERFF